MLLVSRRIPLRRRAMTRTTTTATVRKIVTLIRTMPAAELVGGVAGGGIGGAGGGGGGGNGGLGGGGGGGDGHGGGGDGGGGTGGGAHGGGDTGAGGSKGGGGGEGGAVIHSSFRSEMVGFAYEHASTLPEPIGHTPPCSHSRSFEDQYARTKVIPSERGWCI